MDGKVQLQTYQPGKEELNYDPIFGADPSSLSQTQDSGFKVPQVLSIIRYCLLTNDGLQKENVFRIAGSNDVVKTLKEQLIFAEAKKDFMPILAQKIDDTYALATLIKKFYSQLPAHSKIFANVKNQELILMNLAELKKRIAQPQLDLFLWLLDLLHLTLSFSTKNHQTARSLAVLFSTVLWELPIHDPLDVRASAHQSLSQSTIVSGFLERVLAELDEPVENSKQ